MALLQRFWRAVGPYVIPGPETKKESVFMVTDPILVSISKSPEEHVASFRDIIYIRTLLPLVLGGENKAYTLGWICDQLGGLIQNDLQCDIELDICVEALTEVHGHVRALQGLLATDVGVKIEHRAEIEKFRGLGVHVDQKNPAAVLACAVGDVAWWRDKGNAWSTVQKTLEAQKARLSELATFTKDAKPAPVDLLC